jgi:flagellar basal body-associated protein FliL
MNRQNIQRTFKIKCLTLFTASYLDKNQLEQLCREWAVRIFCVLNDLEDLTCDFYTRGYDRKVWPSDNIPLKDSQLLDHIQSQNSQIRNLLHSACLG